MNNTITCKTRKIPGLQYNAEYEVLAYDRGRVKVLKDYGGKRWIHPSEYEWPHVSEGDTVRILEGSKFADGTPSPSFYEDKKGKVIDLVDEDGDAFVRCVDGSFAYVDPRHLERVEAQETEKPRSKTIGEFRAKIILDTTQLDEAVEKAKELRRIIDSLQR